VPIIVSNISTETSTLFIWWNQTILNMLYDLIQFILFTIRGNCMVISEIIHLHLVCNVRNSSAPIQLHKCVNSTLIVIFPRLKIMKYGILKISCLYTKRTCFPIVYYVLWNLGIFKCVSEQFLEFKFIQHLISSYMNLIYYDYNYNEEIRWDAIINIFVVANSM